MKKGFSQLMLILAVIVIVLLVIYLIGWRLVYDPITGSVTAKLNPQGTFSWLDVWMGGK